MFGITTLNKPPITSYYIHSLRKDLLHRKNTIGAIATGTTKLVSVQKLYNGIGWETLDVRRREQSIK